MASLFGRATPHSLGAVAAATGAGVKENCLLNKPINVLNTTNAQKAVNNVQSKCLGSALRREAKVLIPPLLTSQVSVHTSAQLLLKPNQQVLEASPLTSLVSSQPPPVKPLAEPTHHSILGLPVVHLSLSLVNPPWVQLSQRGILPMAETICQSTQTFCWQNQPIQVKLGSLNPGAKGYHNPLMSVPHQHLPPTNPHLSTEDSDFERGDTVSPAGAGNLSGPSLNEGLLLQHVYSSQERWTCHQSETSEQICEIRAFQNGGATHSQNDWMAKVDLKDAFSWSQ